MTLKELHEKLGHLLEYEKPDLLVLVARDPEGATGFSCLTMFSLGFAAKRDDGHYSVDLEMEDPPSSKNNCFVFWPWEEA